MHLGNTIQATVAFVVAVASAANAQKPRIVVGPMAGVSFSSFSNMPDAPGFEIGTRTGFAAGGFITFNASTHLAVEPQLLYVQKGATSTADYLSDGKLLYVLDYLQLPVLIKGRYWFGDPDRPFSLDAFVGPAIALNVSCRLGVTTGTTVGCDAGSASGSDASTVDLSGVFGLGAEYYGFSLQARYDLSFTNAYSSPTSPSAPVLNDLRNRAWILTLGYKVPVR